jgi:hypothetical protein
MNYNTDRPRRKSAVVLFLLVLIVAGLAAGAWYLRPRFESDPPQIALKPDSDTIGTGPLDIVITDPGTGLKSLEVKLGDATIASEQFAQPLGAKTVTVVLSKLPGVKEGPAQLRVVARDASLFRGNEAVLQKQLTIDITPPTIDLVADDRYVNFGSAASGRSPTSRLPTR